jgi:putative spermidine/putrescine transport system permease protein
MKFLSPRQLPLTIAMIIAAAFVFFPLVSAAEFSLREPAKNTHGFDNYVWFFTAPDFAKYLGISFGLSVVSALILLVILVPTVIWLNLGGSRFRGLVEFISLLPLVIPVVALAIGAQTALPDFAQTNEVVLAFMFAVLAMPYSYRTLDTGLRSIPLKTIVEAARGLGANWFRTIIRVVIPVVRSTVTSALFMTLALSLGEFTLTSLLHWDTFTTWVTTMSQSNVLGAISLSVFSLVAVFALLLVISIFIRPTSNTVAQEEN